MDERKICFIICVNDEMLFDECSLYLKNLHIPAGYKAEVIPVRKAASMAAGYNLAMKKSNAKYKVYLHQDVLIIEKEFISKILKLFSANQNVGMIGVVGNRSLAADGCPWSDGMHRRVGEIYADLITDKAYSLFAKAEAPCEEVAVIDGLLMATQYDIAWREDLFKGWDFYDCSQSMEFIKAGYRVAVPYMERPWCFHDNDILNMKQYEKWRRVFEREYRSLYRRWTDGYTGEGAEGTGTEKKKRAVFQVFFEESSLLDFPYPPVCMEENTDYICFTDSKKVTSKFWKLVYAEDLREYADDYRKNKTVEETLREYGDIREIKPQQILVSKVFDRGDNVPFAVDVLPLEKLPEVKLDLEKLVPTKGEDGEYLYERNPVYMGGRYEGREYLLTIGVPVSNQIETIDRCLSRIKPLLDELDAELVVVDTGSTDGTVEVCEKYGARIVSFPWCDNMSAARNTGIHHARGLWYMSIDDDEWFEDVDDIIKFFKNGTYKNYNAAEYVQKNRLYKTQDVFTENFAIRMAKITPTLHFEGRIHDCLMIEGKADVCPLHSYANHEGFLRDDADKLKKKYRRNAEILLYDVYEYPAHQRYNFQLGNEMANVGYYNEALGYFYRGIAIEMEQPDSYYGRQHAANVLATLYNTTSERIFPLTEQLLKKYRYTDAEMAFFNYNMADVALRYNHEPEEILGYYKKYITYRERYDKNKINNDTRTFTGLHVCRNLAAITDGYVMAFCAYCRMGKDREAAELLKHIRPEEIFNEIDFFAEESVLAEEQVFRQVMGMLSALQYELWLNEFIYAFQRGLQKDGMFDLAAERLYLVIQKFSIRRAERFADALLAEIQDETQEKLCETVMQIDYRQLSLQGLCFNTHVLKKKLAGKKDSDSHMDVFFQYVQTAGLFAQKFYSREVLQSDEDVSIAGDERAAYDIYMALKYMEDENAVGAVEKVAGRLRHALAKFPGFKSEIALILNSISAG